MGDAQLVFGWRTALLLLLSVQILTLAGALALQPRNRTANRILAAFLLVLVRLGWRVTHVPPALPAGMPKLMQFAAHAGHFMLYALMLAIPLTGWLMSSAKGFQTVWFGLLPIPDLLDKNKELGDLLAQVHSALNFLFIAVIVGHVGAALKHHLIDKDDILTRMLPKH